MVARPQPQPWRGTSVMRASVVNTGDNDPGTGPRCSDDLEGSPVADLPASNEPYSHGVLRGYFWCVWQ